MTLKPAAPAAGAPADAFGIDNDLESAFLAGLTDPADPTPGELGGLTRDADLELPGSPAGSMGDSADCLFVSTATREPAGARARGLITQLITQLRNGRRGKRPGILVATRQAVEHRASLVAADYGSQLPEPVSCGVHRARRLPDGLGDVGAGKHQGIPAVLKDLEADVAVGQLDGLRFCREVGLRNCGMSCGMKFS